MHLQKNELTEYFLSRREVFLADQAIDLNELSQNIVDVINEAEKLLKKRDCSSALLRFSELTRYGPLEDLPNFGIHRMLAEIYKSKDEQLHDHHMLRQAAMSDLLLNRIGSGNTLEDPVRFSMVCEALDWSEAKSGRRGLPTPITQHKGGGVYSSTFWRRDLPPDGFFFERTQKFYFAFPPQVEKFFSEEGKLVIPLSKNCYYMFVRAKEKPQLNPRLERIMEFRELLQKMRELNQRGNPEQAADDILEFHAVRSIFDISSNELTDANRLLRSLVDQIDVDRMEKIRELIRKLDFHIWNEFARENR